MGRQATYTGGLQAFGFSGGRQTEVVVLLTTVRGAIGVLLAGNHALVFVTDQALGTATVAAGIGTAARIFGAATGIINRSAVEAAVAIRRAHVAFVCARACITNALVAGSAVTAIDVGSSALADLVPADIIFRAGIEVVACNIRGRSDIAASGFVVAERLTTGIAIGTLWSLQ